MQKGGGESILLITFKEGKMRTKRLLLLIGILLLVSVISMTAFAGEWTVKASKQWKIAFVPKLIGIPYFNAMENGGKRAAKDRPNHSKCPSTNSIYR